MTRREQVIQLLTAAGLALDDDDIAGRLSISRHDVNQLRRTLDAEGVTLRAEGPVGKYVNQMAQDPVTGNAPPVCAPPVTVRPRAKRSDRARRNIEALVDQFNDSIVAFEVNAAFPGPRL